MIAWALPVFRQLRTNLFYFFLALGLSDPLTLILFKVFNNYSGIISIIVAPILFWAVNVDRQKKFSVNKLEIFIVILTFSLYLLIDNYNITMLIIHIAVTIRAIFKVIFELHIHQKINLGNVVIAFYMISSVASLLIYLNGDHQAMILFYTNLAFQILIAIFFSFFRTDNPKLTFKVVPVIDD